MEHLGLASDGDVDVGVVAPEELGDGDDTLHRLVVVAGDAGQYQRLALVRRAQRRNPPQAPVRHRATDVGLLAGQPGQFQALGGHGRAVDVLARPGFHHQDQVGVTGVELAVEELRGPGGRGARVVEAAVVELLGHAGAEQRRHDEQQAGADEHGPAAADEELGEAGEHGS